MGLPRPNIYLKQKSRVLYTSHKEDYEIAYARVNWTDNLHKTVSIPGRLLRRIEALNPKEVPTDGIYKRLIA